MKKISNELITFEMMSWLSDRLTRMVCRRAGVGANSLARKLHAPKLSAALLLINTGLLLCLIAFRTTSREKILKRIYRSQVWIDQELADSGKGKDPLNDLFDKKRVR